MFYVHFHRFKTCEKRPDHVFQIWWHFTGIFTGSLSQVYAWVSHRFLPVMITFWKIKNFKTLSDERSRGTMNRNVLNGISFFFALSSMTPRLALFWRKSGSWLEPNLLVLHQRSHLQKFVLELKLYSGIVHLEQPSTIEDFLVYLICFKGQQRKPTFGLTRKLDLMLFSNGPKSTWYMDFRNIFISKHM